MIQAASLNPVSLCVASDGPHVALGNLGFDGLPGGSRAAEVESLDDARPMVEVEPPVLGAAVNAPVFPLVGTPDYWGDQSLGTAEMPEAVA